MPQSEPHYSANIQRRHNLFIFNLHVFVLGSFGVAQPLYDLLARQPEFLAVHGSRTEDVILLVLFLSFLIPLVIAIFQRLVAALSARLGTYLQYLLTGLLVVIIALSGLRAFRLGSGTVLALALASGLLFVWAYSRFQVSRTFLTLLSPGILIFPLVFLLDSEISQILFSDARHTRHNGGEEVRVRAPAPVVMVVFDEFPTLSLLDQERGIDQARFPNLHALGQDSYWFRNATTVSGGTLISIPAILTAVYAKRQRSLLPTLENHPRNLFTLLQDSHELHVFENVTRLDPQSSEQDLRTRVTSLLWDCTIVYLHHLLPPALAAKHLPSISQSWKDFGKDTSGSKENWSDFQPDWSRRHFKFMKFIEAIVPKTRKPGLFFLHSALPHASWKYLPSGRLYTLYEKPVLRGVIGPNNQGIDVNQWLQDQWLVVQGYQRHLLQIGFVDTLVGQLIDHLKDLELYDDALIVITADHGCSFLPGHSRRQVTETTHPGVILVPMIIKVPGQKEGFVSDRNVETIDILPTIVDALGIELNWRFDGRSLLQESLPARENKRVYDTATRRVFSFDPQVQAQKESLQRKLNWFGSNSVSKIFTIGPFPDLPGKPLAEVQIGKPGQGRYELKGRQFLEKVDLEGPFVPAQITGNLRMPGAEQLPWLAVEVNGVVRAVTRPDADGTFTAVVPEQAFRQGRNSVSVFQIEQRGRGTILRPLEGISARHFELISQEESESLRSEAGADVPITREGVTGWVVAGWNRDSEFIEIGGWAADLSDLSLPEAVLVFGDGKFIGLTQTALKSPGVVQGLGKKELSKTGFHIDLPRSRFGDVFQTELRVFALSRRGIAGELHYPPEGRLDKWCFRPNPKRELDSVTRALFRQAKRVSQPPDQLFR